MAVLLFNYNWCILEGMLKANGNECSKTTNNSLVLSLNYLGLEVFFIPPSN